MQEKNIQKNIMLAVSPETKIFRNNVGVAWIGQSVKLKSGDVLIKNPRIFHAGLCKGSSDLIGWTTKTITPEMVGSKVAVFTAIEVKKTEKSPVRPEQVKFIDAVKRDGGMCGISWNINQALKITGKL